MTFRAAQGARLRKVTLVLGAGLHLSIALLMNLPIFGIAMIGLLIVCTTRLSTPPVAISSSSSTEKIDRAHRAVQP